MGFYALLVGLFIATSEQLLVRLNNLLRFLCPLDRALYSDCGCGEDEEGNYGFLCPLDRALYSDGIS